MDETQATLIQEETNRIVESIEAQKLDGSKTSAFIYALFAIVAISMIFENLVRSYRRKIHDKKATGEPVKEFRIKLWITYGIHVIVVLLYWAICKFLLQFTFPYLAFLIAITIYMVGISPLFAVYIRFKKEENK